MALLQTVLTRKGRFLVAALALAGGMTFAASGASADEAVAGNGGTAVATADGGPILIGDINSGGNSGNLISVGDTGGV